MTQDTRAFELREDVDSELFGGSITLGDGTAWDVGAALEEQNGIIVADDLALIAALDAYPALKRTAVPAGALGWDSKTVSDLEAEIESRNAGRDDDDKIEVAPPGNKAELVAALVADDNESE